MNTSGTGHRRSPLSAIRSIRSPLSAIRYSLFCCLLANLASAAGPLLQSVEPLGAMPGRTTRLVLSGENLEGALDLWTSFPATVAVEDAGKDKANTFALTVPGDLAPSLGAIRWVGSNGISQPYLFLLDPLRAVPATGTNRTPFSAQLLTIPAAVDGTCEEVRSDFYRFRGRRGQRLTVEVVAKRLGSALDPLLRILDADRRELAAVDDSSGLDGDARLDFRCPQTADYLVELRDTQYSGGARHRYRLRIGRSLPAPLPFSWAARGIGGLPQEPPRLLEREPNHGPGQAQRIQWPVELDGGFDKPGDRDVFEFAAEKGDTLWVQGRTRSLGWPCDLLLQLQTTNGTRVAEANASSADEGMLTNRFAEAGTYRLHVEDLNRQGGPPMRYRLRLEPLRPGFVLSVDTERVSARPGESFEVNVQAQRRDYDGPIQLTLAGLDSRFVVTNAVLPAKTNSVKIIAAVPTDLALGEFFDFQIVGRATVKNHEVADRASTLPALRTVLPNLRSPPLELDGMVTLSIATGQSSTPVAPRKKRGTQ